MNRRPLLSAFLSTFFVLGLSACDGGGDELVETRVAETESDTPHVSHPGPGVKHEKIEKHGDELHPPHAPHRVMPEAKSGFEEFVTLLESEYVDGSLSEDELWTAATEGVLQRLIQHEGHEVNSLLSPEELHHLLSGTEGSIVGVGIMVEQVADVVVVKGLVPGGPAMDSGLMPGDRILAVDGQKLKELGLGESVNLIRGEEGTPVELFVQRETEEWTLEVTRGVVKVSSVESKMFDDVGYLRINSFSKSTTEDVDAHLKQLGDAGMKQLVLDLRKNPGGLFETAVSTADRFLPAGTRVVTVRGPKGDEHHDTSETHPWEEVPMVVLVGKKTASGAEILAAALGEHDRAMVVGEPTFGKGTVEAIHELDNGWALKLSKARFFAPGSEDEHVPGVIPNIEVQSADGVPDGTIDEVHVDGDAPLKAAVELLAKR